MLAAIGGFVLSWKGAVAGMGLLLLLVWGDRYDWFPLFGGGSHSSSGHSQMCS